MKFCATSLLSHPSGFSQNIQTDFLLDQPYPILKQLDLFLYQMHYQHWNKKTPNLC